MWINLLNKTLLKAVTQFVGVPGNDYKIYFYKTYLNKLKERQKTSDNTNTASNSCTYSSVIEADKRKINGNKTLNKQSKKLKSLTFLFILNYIFIKTNQIVKRIKK